MTSVQEREAAEGFPAISGTVRDVTGAFQEDFKRVLRRVLKVDRRFFQGVSKMAHNSFRRTKAKNSLKHFETI